MVRRQHERFASGHEKLLATGVAVGSLGDRGDAYVAYPEFSQHGKPRSQLALSAVKQHEIGPLPELAIGIFLLRAREAAVSAVSDAEKKADRTISGNTAITVPQIAFIRVLAPR